MSAIASAQSADQTPDVLKKLYSCKDIAAPMERLACYDSSVGRVESAQETGELVAIDREAAEEIKKESFGFNIPSLPKIGFLSRRPDTNSGAVADETSDDRIILAIDRIKTLPRGEIRFYLQNGQIWQQNSKTRISKLKKGQENFLHIRKASVGSYLAQVNGKGPGMRIKRRE